MRAILSPLAACLCGAWLAACDEAPKVAAKQVVGVWSFDGSCQSGDGMRIKADGSMWFTECCEGTWRLDGDLLSLRIREHGQTGGSTTGKPGPWETVVMRIERIDEKAMTYVWVKNKKRVTARLCRRN